MGLVRHLTPDTLAALPPDVSRPAYDRAGLEPGIVHLGLGAFARAHLLPLTEAAVTASGDRRWGVVGVSLRHPDTRDALEPQQGLYTLAVRDGAGTRLQVIGCLLKLRVAPEDPGAVVAQIAAPATRIVSLTITEKGYHAEPGGAADLIARALQRRRAAGQNGLTLMSLDNLPSNGQEVKRFVRACAHAIEPGLADWIEEHCSFPCSMVDRIVPRTSNQDRAQVAEALGVEDAWPVIAEPFLDWAVEDRFVAGRPDWSVGGARFVPDARPFEQLKLRVVNGGHSALAYLGALLGLPTVDRAVADADLRCFVEALLREEVEPTLPALPGVDLAGYRARLLHRFDNAALQHPLLRVAMDGSLKIPQRWLATVHDRLAAGQDIGLLALCVASWLRFIDGHDELGRPLPLDDPQAGPLREARRAGDGGLGYTPVFGELGRDARFVRAVQAAEQALQLLGVRRAVAASAAARRPDPDHTGPQGMGDLT